MTRPGEVNKQDVDHFQLRSLLLLLGWTRVGGTPGSFSAWSDGQDADRDNELLLPEDPSRGDYQTMLRRARNTLVHTYGSVAREALSTIALRSSAMLDATKWAKESPVDAGIIDWRTGESLYAAARLGLAAAAKASKEPKRYFGNSSSHIAKRLLDETLMGQTEVGSFVITAYTPAGGRFYFSKAEESSVRGKLLDAKSRSGAEIIDKLASIVGEVRDTLDIYKKSPRIEQFDELVQDGLSHEMASSLASLCESSVGRLRVERAGATSATPAREFEFVAAESLVLGRVANRFSETREPRPVRLVGEVSLLDHLRTDDKHTIRLHVSNQPDIRVVRVSLSPEQYRLALEAHADELPLLVAGTVEKEKKYNWVRDPTTVSLNETAVDDDDNESETESPAQDPLF